MRLLTEPLSRREPWQIFRSDSAVSATIKLHYFNHVYPTSTTHSTTNNENDNENDNEHNNDDNNNDNNHTNDNNPLHFPNIPRNILSCHTGGTHEIEPHAPYAPNTASHITYVSRITASSAEFPFLLTPAGPSHPPRDSRQHHEHAPAPPLRHPDARQTTTTAAAAAAAAAACPRARDAGAVSQSGGRVGTEGGAAKGQGTAAGKDGAGGGGGRRSCGGDDEGAQRDDAGGGGGGEEDRDGDGEGGGGKGACGACQGADVERLGRDEMAKRMNESEDPEWVSDKRKREAKLVETNNMAASMGVDTPFLEEMLGVKLKCELNWAAQKRNVDRPGEPEERRREE
ncbi:uncharacterized protein BKCO1_980008 [Diplodia corticola]|uniref:Uncharacterized protein n=1 Tax=Diplodia corticola TaxID=236234 RepID=A0A1J9RM58_9PEZI|nr:uncharacterized protein BKCO1_980008 [Diplodia corticola]OJD29004.1 hypothetical protein BKCO1_980008 [Diplodia corticola]